MILLYTALTLLTQHDDWLANVEEATGLNINVIAAPTDTDTRQQRITTILSTRRFFRKTLSKSTMK